MHASQSLPEDDMDEEEAEETFASECQDIREAMSIKLPPLQLRDEPSHPFGQGNLAADSLDLSSLVSMRFQHQTRHAAKAVRVQGPATVTNTSSSVIRTDSFGGAENDLTPNIQKGESVRRQLIREFHAVLKEQQDKGTGSGLERVARWRSEGNVMDNERPTITGNAANAASAAKQVAKTVRSP